MFANTKLFGIMICALFLTACAGMAVLEPVSQIQLLKVAPEPSDDNEAQYMAPYTSDGVVAEWVEKGRSASLGASAGGTVGSYVGAKALGSVPLFGSFLGQSAGEKIGRSMAIKSAGGMEFIKESSDLSFNEIDELCSWLYVYYRTNEHFDDVLKYTGAIYPEFDERYSFAVSSIEAQARQMSQNIHIN